MTTPSPTPSGARLEDTTQRPSDTVRPELRIGGHDPSTAAGKMAWLSLEPRLKARYLHRIDYLEADCSALLALLGDSERDEVLAWQDRDGCWRD